MAEIMGAFAHDLDNFVAYYEKQQWDTSFRGEQYPPRIVMEQSTPPLFEVGADGAKTLVPNPTIQIIGRPETEVVTTGKLQISKKDFTNLTNRAAALLELFLHGFMQERKELEAAQEGQTQNGPGPDPKGARGAWGHCPKCGASDCEWDAETDVCTCKACGYTN